MSRYDCGQNLAELTEVALQFFLEEAIWNVVYLERARLVRRYGSSLLVAMKN